MTSALASLLCPRCEPIVVQRNPEHDLPGVVVGHIVGKRTNLLGALAPMVRIVDERGRHWTPSARQRHRRPALHPDRLTPCDISQCAAACAWNRPATPMQASALAPDAG